MLLTELIRKILPVPATALANIVCSSMGNEDRGQDDGLRVNRCQNDLEIQPASPVLVPTPTQLYNTLDWRQRGAMGSSEAEVPLSQWFPASSPPQPQALTM